MAALSTLDDDWLRSPRPAPFTIPPPMLVLRLLEHRRRRAMVQGTVRTNLVIGLPPTLDQHLRLQQRKEDLPVQQLVPKLAVERLHVPILPGTLRFDEQRLHTHLRQPSLHGFGRQLGPDVRPNAIRHTPPDERLRQALQHVVRRPARRHVDGQTLGERMLERGSADQLIARARLGRRRAYLDFNSRIGA